ncbi:MAG TPA: hypothetical protein VF969_07600 [Burkholderiales bacterium]
MLNEDEETTWQLCVERAKRFTREHAARGSERARAEKEVTKLEAEIGRLVNALVSGKATADVTAAIAERRSKVEALKSKLAEPVTVNPRRLTEEERRLYTGPLVKATSSQRSRRAPCVQHNPAPSGARLPDAPRIPRRPRQCPGDVDATLDPIAQRR